MKKWRPRATRKSVRRPKIKLVDDIRVVAGQQWIRIARNRQEWKMMEETYVQEWTDMG